MKRLVAALVLSLILTSYHSFNAYADGPCDVNVAEMDMIAKIVESEDGNQDLIGRRLVAAVVMNRVDDPRFPGTVAEVICQPGQFAVMRNGMYDRAIPSELTYLAVYSEYEERAYPGIVYFSRGKQRYARNHFKWMDHWFGY